MELQYIVMTIIKILISVPAILVVYDLRVHGAALMGGYLNNNVNFTGPTNYTSLVLEKEESSDQKINRTRTEEEIIPDPSPLVLPGYNLPENIFNKGKPFYLEKDPLTGQIDFDSRTSLSNVEEEEFYYSDEEPSGNIFDKANIDRKDGSLASHKPNDVNQLTPNFHDFLNLPVKYNPDKYVYPLISSSYANTKVQGNINKYYNHKDYAVTTYKPIISHTYYTVKTPYFSPDENKTTQKVTTSTTSQKPITTTTIATTTSRSPNLMDGAIGFPNLQLPSTTTTTTSTITTAIKKPQQIDAYLTTQNSNDVYLTTKRFSAPTTTRRTLSLFEQIFGEYDEISTTTETISKPPYLFQNLPVNKNNLQVTTRPPDETEVHNVLTGSDMDYEGAYSYEEYETFPSESQNNAIVRTGETVKLEIIPNTTTTTTPSTTTTRTTTPTTTTMTTTTKTTTTTTTTERPLTDYDSNEYDFEIDEFETYKPQPDTTTAKVTSLPLGENHFGTQNARPPMRIENVAPKPFAYQHVASSNSVRIPANQNTISFVVGNHQNVGGGYVANTFKDGPYDKSPFRPLITETNDDKDAVSFTIQTKPTFSQTFHEPMHKIAEIGGSSINIQPIRTSEASLSIGVPINDIKKVPGQVVDENLDNEKIEFPKKGTGAKIIFPDNTESATYTPNLIRPPPPPQQDILQLNSKPVYHQLPSDLTPPSEQRVDRPRPPWDPRPGHFYNGRPEYSRPPRPQLKSGPGDIYKRIDNLPNILPQFRPNAKVSNGPPHYFDHMLSMKNGFMRQPLLERPSNRPVGFYEKLVPPPPPKNLHNLRKVPILEQDLRVRTTTDDVIKQPEQYELLEYSTPPPLILSNRREGEEPAVETLQMIQAKHVEKKDLGKSSSTSVFKTNLKGKDVTEKPLYVVYPVNSAPIKLDALDSNKKETVVIGTRAELPLPPSKINQEFTYESPQDRNDSPILKPHTKPSTFPLKTDFPYPLERPDVSSNNLEFKKGNRWDGIDTESRIITGTKINYKNPNQISVTLKTYTEKPIAVAYTPTEPYKKLENTEKYSMPNYASPVISEIRPGVFDKSDSEITVSAIMHTHPQVEVAPIKYVENHKFEEKEVPAKLEFQAPFHASMNVDGYSQGWTVVRSNEKMKIDRSDQEVETTTSTMVSTSEFDIENFKPQLFGGFKPIYSYPEGGTKTDESEPASREERK